MKLALIIPAAGASRRFNAGDPAMLRSKLDEDLGGRPVLQRTLELFVNNPEIGPLVGPVVVAGPRDPEAFAAFKLRHGDRLGLLGAALCPGGQTHRWETVLAALAHLRGMPGWPDVTHVAVHDAARPCAPAEMLERVLAAAERDEAVIPAVEVIDTLKRVREEDAPAHADPIADILGTAPARRKRRAVEQTVDRRGLMAAQTPQVFRRDLFEKAYAQKDLHSTDDAQLVERLGASVTVVAGDERNIKITGPGDMRLARAILGVRDGEGRDTHKRF